MKVQDFEAKVEKLEQEAARNYPRYVQVLTGLALLGYAYIFGMMVFLIALVVLFFWLMVTLHAWVFLKLGFFYLVFVFVILKSLWVRFPPPTGVAIERLQVPALFDCLERIRQAAAGPAVHAVLLTDEFNCAITQVPQLGIFGFYKNYLIVGLPILQAFSLPQFEAILAHEMGHLSHKHGKFGSWIYQVRTSWLQIYGNLSQHGGAGLIRGFANWFFPLFDAHSLVVRRRHEYEADQISGSIAGKDVMAQALLNVGIKGALLQKTFWPGVFKEADNSAEPPSGTYAVMRNMVNNPIPVGEAKMLVLTELNRFDVMDSHPRLADRIRALQPDLNLDDMSGVAQEALDHFSGDQTAAEALFGDSLPGFEKTLEAEWQARVKDSWSERYRLVGSYREELNKLEQALATGDEPLENSLRRARLTAVVGSMEAATVIARELNTTYPDDADVNYLLGTCLLDRHDEAGIALLQRAMQLQPMMGYRCCEDIHRFLSGLGRNEEAQQYVDKARDFADQVNNAAAALRTISRNDKFEQHSLTAEQVESLCESLYADPRVKQAYLIDKIVPVLAGSKQTVLVVKLGPPVWYIRDAVLINKAPTDLAQTLPEGIYVLNWERVQKNVADACKSLPDAYVYERSHFDLTYPQKPDAMLQQARWRLHRLRKAWYERNWVIGVVLLIVAILCIFSFLQMMSGGHSLPHSGKYAHMKSYMKELRSRIRRNWLPPKSPNANRVVVQFRVPKNGQVSQVKIEKSSGSDVLDRAAVEAVSNSSPFESLPEGAPDFVDIKYTFDYSAHSR